MPWSQIIIGLVSKLTGLGLKINNYSHGLKGIKYTVNAFSCLLIHTNEGGNPD